MIVLLPEHAELTNAEVAKLVGASASAVAMARRRLAGSCQYCQRPATAGIFCDRHYKRVNASRRKRSGAKPWRPGAKGRPPLNREPKE
jgi:hypothetical protein